MSHLVRKAIILGGQEFGAGAKVELNPVEAERLERLGCVEKPKAPKRSTAAKRAAK